MEPRGWFADLDENQPYSDGTPGYGWQPTLALGPILLGLQVWFKTEAECVAFIRDEIIPFASQMVA